MFTDMKVLCSSITQRVLSWENITHPPLNKCYYFSLKFAVSLVIILVLAVVPVLGQELIIFDSHLQPNEAFEYEDWPGDGGHYSYSAMSEYLNISLKLKALDTDNSFLIVDIECSKPENGTMYIKEGEIAISLPRELNVNYSANHLIRVDDYNTVYDYPFNHTDCSYELGSFIWNKLLNLIIIGHVNNLAIAINSCSETDDNPFNNSIFDNINTHISFGNTWDKHPESDKKIMKVVDTIYIENSMEYVQSTVAAKNMGLAVSLNYDHSYDSNRENGVCHLVNYDVYDNFQTPALTDLSVSQIGTNLNLSWSNNDYIYDNIEITIDEENIVTISGSETSYLLSGLSNGIHNISISGIIEGNKSEATTIQFPFGDEYDGDNLNPVLFDKTTEYITTYEHTNGWSDFVDIRDKFQLSTRITSQSSINGGTSCLEIFVETAPGWLDFTSNHFFVFNDGNISIAVPKELKLVDKDNEITILSPSDLYAKPVDIPCRDGLFDVIVEVINSEIPILAQLGDIFGLLNIISDCNYDSDPFYNTEFKMKSNFKLVSGVWDVTKYPETDLKKCIFRCYFENSFKEVLSILKAKGFGLSVESQFHVGSILWSSLPGEMHFVISGIKPNLNKAIEPCDFTLTTNSPAHSPQTGDINTEFVFSAEYADPGGVSPLGVQISIDEGPWIEMTANGTTFSSGVSYSISQSGFSVGEHTYKFRCLVDGCDDIIIGPFEFTVGMPSSPGLTFTASPDVVCAYTEESQLTATLLDDYGNPIVGEYIFIYPRAGGSVSDVSNGGITDGNGRVTAVYEGDVVGTNPVTADPDNYDPITIPIEVEQCPECPFSVTILPRLDNLCGGTVRYTLEPKIFTDGGGCLPPGDTIVWTITNCDGAWWGNGDQNAIITGQTMKVRSFGGNCNSRFPTVNYNGSGPCDATISLGVQGYNCNHSIVIHMDTACPQSITPIASFGSSFYGYEYGKLVQFSSDDSTLAGPGSLLSVIETRNFGLLRNFVPSSEIASFSHSPTGDSIAMTDGNDKYFLYLTRTGAQLVGDKNIGFETNCMVWSDTRDRIALTDVDDKNAIHILRPDGSHVITLSTGYPDDQIFDLSWRNGRLAAVSDHRRVHVWNASTDSYTEIWSYGDDDCGAEFYGCDFNSDASRLAVVGYWTSSPNCSADNFYVFSGSSNTIQQSASLDQGGRDWNDVCWSADDSKILVAGVGGALVFDANSIATRIMSLSVSPTDATWCDWSTENVVAVTDAANTKIFTPYDQSPPVFANVISSVGASTQLDTATVSGAYIDEYSIDPTGVTMAVNGGVPIGIFDTSWSFEYRMDLQEGENVIALQAADRMGHVGYDTLIITRTTDTTGPVIASIAVGELYEVGSSVEIASTIIDQWSGVNPDSVLIVLYDEMDALIDSIPLSPVGDDSTYSGVWNSESECEGIIRIAARAVDLKGNVTIRPSAAHFGLFDYPELRSVTIDPIDPTDTTVVGVMAEWSDCSDLSSAVVYYIHGDTSGSWQQRNMSISDHNANVNLPKANTGWMFFKVSTTDIYAHNSTSPVDSYFVADVSPPQVVQLLEPYDNRHTNETKPMLTWLPSSDVGGSGIASYSVEYANNAMFTPSDTAIVASGTSWTPTIDLAYGQYYWRVWASDESGNNGDVSATWSFFVDNQAPLQPDSIYVNEDLVPVWTNDSVFAIRYVESDEEFSGTVIASKTGSSSLSLSDTSGISVAYYKLGTQPTDNGDFLGVTPYNPFELVVTERDVLYVWLKDGAGNVDYQNWASVDLLFDDDPVIGVEASVVRDTLNAGDTLEVTWSAGSDGAGSGITEVYDVFYKIGTADWQVLATGLSNTTGLDTLSDFISEDSNWVFLEVTTRDQVGNYDSTGTAEDSVYILRNPTDVGEDTDSPLPSTFSLSQNYPNPFNPTTSIEFDLPRRSQVKVIVYNLLGQEVSRLVDQEFPAGNHRITWDGSTISGVRASTGFYFYRLEAEGFIETKKMLLLK